jgi:hypothetical protein
MKRCRGHTVEAPDLCLMILLHRAGSEFTCRPKARDNPLASGQVATVPGDESANVVTTAIARELGRAWFGYRLASSRPGGLRGAASGAMNDTKDAPCGALCAIVGGCKTVLRSGCRGIGTAVGGAGGSQ